MPYRLVLLVEGEGDVEAAPVVSARLLKQLDGWEHLFLDPNPLRTGDVSSLVKNDYQKWRRLLGVCRKRKDFGASILLLDGDIRRVNNTDFCPVTVARQLAKVATEEGAGQIFSVGVSFACQEFESWAIAACESLSGLTFSDGLKLNEQLVSPPHDLEAAPRDAKRWFTENMNSGSYRQTTHQAQIAHAMNLQAIRDRPMRSFLRFENSIRQIIDAFATGVHVSTPMSD